MTRLTLVIALCACACSKTNPNYCPNAPQHNCSNDAPGVDSPKGCQSGADCAGTADPVCDLLKHQCVQCNASDTSQCTGMTPVCDVTTERCRGCQTHADCGSPGACLPDGSCGTDSNVAWVASSGVDGSNTCTQAMPCVSITHALLQNKPYIKVASGPISDQPTIQQNVVILADAGAKLLSVTTGPMVTIKGSPNVEIHDLRITQGASLTTGFGIYDTQLDSPMVTLDHVIIDTNASTGIVMSGGHLTMSRCVVSGNTGGGANLSIDFDITNSLFVANGGPTTAIGGLELSPASTSYKFAFNTIAANASATATSNGMVCIAPVSGTGTIIQNGAGSGCTLAYSLFPAGATVSGSNKAGDPAFVNTSAGDPTAANYYRIGVTSPAIDNADPTSSIAVDIDDHPRPQGSTYDIGASEYMP